MDKEKTTRSHSVISVRIPNHLKESIEKLAESEKRNMSLQAWLLIEEGLKSHLSEKFTSSKSAT